MEFEAHHNAYVNWLNISDEAERKKDLETIQLAKEKISEAETRLDSLKDFRKKLKKYCSSYSYISQIVDFGEPDLEVFYGFAKLLYHKISDTSVEEIEIKNLVLADFRINQLDKPNDANGTSPLRPMTAGGKKSSTKKERLKTIVLKINEIWGEDSSTVTGARTINAIADYVSADDVTRIQIRNSSNTKEAIIADGRMENIIRLAAVALKNNDFEQMADKIINDSQSWRPLAEVIYHLIDRNKRLDIPELMTYVKKG